MNPFRILDMPLEELVAAWTGQYVIKGSLKSADCVLGWSFGYRGEAGSGHAKPGLSNQDLANVAIKHYDKLPKIIQFEIADAYEAAGGSGEVHRISRHRKRGKYLDTWEVGVQAKALMEKHGYKKAVLLADPYHMPRVQMVCDRLGIEWVATGDLVGAVEFDPLSSQKWTRDLDHWRGYEPLAMMFYRAKGYL